MEWSNFTIKSIEAIYEDIPKSIASQPSKAVTLYLNAVTLYENGDYEKAIIEAEKLLTYARREEAKFLLHSFMAHCLWEVEDINKSISEAKTALKYRNSASGIEVFWCHNILGLCYLRKNNYKKAIKKWSEGIKFTNERDALFAYYQNMSWLYVLRGDFQNIEKMAQSALQYAESNCEIAMCYDRIGYSEFNQDGHEQETIKYEKICLEYIEKILSNEQEDIPYWRERAYLCYKALFLVYGRIGEMDKAVEAASHALDYTDGDRSEKVFYGMMSQCARGREDGSAIKPLRMLLRYCDTDEEKSKVHDDLAGEYMNINDWVRAREELEAAIELNPKKEIIGVLLEAYHIDEDIQLCKNLIIKYDVHKDDPGVTDYVKNDPELKKYLK